MDRARNQQDGLVYEALELLELENPREMGWMCHVCGIEVIPVACDGNKKAEYKRAPHFRVAGNGIVHDCGVDGPNVAVKVKGKKSIINIAGKAMRNISKVRFKSKYVRNPSKECSSSIDIDGFCSKGTRCVKGSHADHNTMACTIRPVCIQYIDSPCARHYPLDIPGVEGETYFECFKPCKFIKKDERLGRYIYIFQVLFANSYTPRLDDERLILHSYETYRTNSSSDRPHFKFIIDVSSWKKGSITHFLNCIQETKEDFSLKNKIYPYVFVLADQDANKPWVLHCDDIRYIFTKASTSLWP